MTTIERVVTIDGRRHVLRIAIDDDGIVRGWSLPHALTPDDPDRELLSWYGKGFADALWWRSEREAGCGSDGDSAESD